MEWGTLAEWVGAAGGLLAVVAAVVAWRSSERMLRLEQGRDDQRNRAALREQAELVFALGARLPERDDREMWAIYLHNGSSKPIFDVCVESKKLDGSSDNYPLRLGAVPPGRFVIPSSPKFHWGSPIDLSLSPESVEFLVKGQTKMITSLKFSDSSRQRWELLDGNQLVEVKSA